MLAVAVVGILAAIAVPNFVKMQLRAKRAELPSNTDGIKTAQLGYEATYDQFVNVNSFHPRGTNLDKKLATWTTGSAFDDLGWAPDGDVRGSYATVTTSASDFLVYALADMDADGSFVLYMATKDTNAATPSATYNDIY